MSDRLLLSVGGRCVSHDGRVRFEVDSAIVALVCC